jgi:hypothetical protein
MDNYNCFGLVAFICGWFQDLRFVSDIEMKTLLDKNSYPIDSSKIERGDIAIYYMFGEIYHTAIVTNVEKEELVHKPASKALEFQNFRGTLGKYDYGEIGQFRRNKPNLTT